MEITDLAAIGYAVAMAAFAALAILMLSLWKDRPKAGLVALASGATAIWACLQTIGSLGYLNDPAVLLIIEWVRNVAWLTALASILRDIDQAREIEGIALRYGAVFLVAVILLILYYSIRTSDPASMIGIVAGGILLSSLNLILAEQIYRNAPFDVRSSLKYFCVGIAGIFFYDFVVFAWTVANSEMSVNQWAARGYVNALFAIPLAFAARRSFRLSLDAHIPRQIIFYSFGIIGSGIFVIVLLLGDYYVRTYAGTWGGVVRILLFIAALMALAVGTVSATVRARVRVFLTKSFFQYKYDYRKEWLRFISTLSGSEPENVAVTAVRAVAQIVNSPGGVVWIRESDHRNYTPSGSWNCSVPLKSSVGRDAQLVQFLWQRQWVIDLNELREHPTRYGGLNLDAWVGDHREWWLIVPLFLQNDLFGFIVLEKPRSVPSLNFEDHDLLRTVGRHVATHIHQAESDRRLTESRQFGAYNRLTAFLMHDLNNLIAQQSLVVKNAEKFRHNPDFVDDAIDTIANSVSRMRRLMEQLSSGSEKPVMRDVEIDSVLRKAAQRCEPRRPEPRFSETGGSISINADPERLTTVLEHLIRNAQDATEEDGRIDVAVSATDGVATISISDTGCGMTADFIRERLFRPFDSTKGSQSMGIGAYQVREYIRQLGGQIEVASTVGEGTRFDIRLPMI